MKKFEKLKVQAKEHMGKNEEQLAVIFGAYETSILGSKTVRNGILIASNDRIVFYAKKLTGYDLESFPYSNISSIEMSKGMMGHKITFFSSGNKVEVKWINTIPELGEFMDIVRDKVGKKNTESPAPMAIAVDTKTDVASELRKFAELKNDGIISEEEFNAKKKELLG